VQRGRTEMFYPTSMALFEIKPYMNDPHVAMLDAIITRDADAAASMMADHVTDTWRTVSLYITSGEVYEPHGDR
jgi:DNA-binding GntR family transcriptional regulator